jgi:hypothetical protein
VHVDGLGPVAAVASEVVRDAARFMRGAEPSAIAYTFTKANGSPVTAADFVVPNPHPSISASATGAQCERGNPPASTLARKLDR